MVMLAESKLNSAVSKISEVLINNDINNEEDFTTITEEEKNYLEPKQCIKMMKYQRSDTEKKI